MARPATGQAAWDATPMRTTRSIPEQRQAELGRLWVGLQAHLHAAAQDYLKRLPREQQERLMPFVPVKP